MGSVMRNSGQRSTGRDGAKKPLDLSQIHANDPAPHAVTDQLTLGDAAADGVWVAADHFGGLAYADHLSVRLAVLLSGHDALPCHSSTSVVVRPCLYLA